MEIKSFNKTHEAMAKSKNALLQLVSQVSENKTYYDSMANELSRSFSESQTHWTKKTIEDQNDCSRYAGEILTQIDAIADELKNIENQLCQIDKCYEKRKINEFTLRVVDDKNSYTTAEQYLSKLKKISDEVKKLASECSLSVKNTIVQEIGMLFSNKRKEMYERLYDLVVEGLKLRDIAFTTIQRQVYSKRAELDKKRDEEIDKAANETAELMQQIEEQQIKAQNEILYSCEASVKSVLSDSDIDTIMDMADTLQRSCEVSESFTEYICLGSLKQSVSEVLHYPFVSDVVRRIYKNNIMGQSLVLPAIYDLRDNTNFFIDTIDSEAAKNAIHSIMYSMIKNQPASKQCFYLYDPEGRSRGFDMFLNFVKSFPDIMGDKVLTTQQQIRTQIEQLSNFVDEIGQTKLASYSDIFEYNAEVSDKSESMKCLCLLDFPKYFDESMLDSLYNIVKNGTPYGVNVLIHYNVALINERANDSYLQLIERIKEYCHSVEYDGMCFSLSTGVNITFNELPSRSEMSMFEEIYLKNYKEVKNAALPIEKISPRNEWFKGDTTKKLSIPIGKNEDGNVQCVEFGDVVGNGTSHHALVFGSLGSGKSTLLHTIIMSAITKYGPDELNLYLMDFKSGTEFKVYANNNIPHIKLLALDAMQEFGQSILDELWEIMQERIRLIAKLNEERGIDVRNITQYREATGEKMPRILVIADEFQMLFSEDNNRKVANYCAGKLADFISICRVYGIHFILATQTMSRLSSGFTVRRSTLNEMYVRIGMQCTDMESNQIFGDVNGRIAFKKMGTEKGSAVYSENYSRTTPTALKVAYCNPEAQEAILSEVESRFSLMETSEKTKVFSGDSVPDIKECVEFNSFDENETFNSVPIYLGEPIKIAPPVRINVNRMKRSTLLIMGSNNEMLDRLVALYILSAVKSHPHLNSKATNTSVYLFDGLTMMGEMMSEYTRSVVQNNAMDIKSVQNVYEVAKTIDELYSVYEKRRKQKMNSGGTTTFNTIHIVLNNFQWIEPIALMLANKKIDDFIIETREQNSNADNISNDLFGFVPEKKHPNDITSSMDMFMSELSESKANNSNISYHKKLMTLIETGYSYGINVVLSCPDLVSIKEIIYEVIPKFQNRIVFGVSNTDADRIIQEAKTEKLKSNIVIFSDGINQSYQFKPFDGFR